MHRDLCLWARRLRFLISGRWGRQVGKGWFCLFRGRIPGGFSWPGNMSVSAKLEKEEGILRLLKVPCLDDNYCCYESMEGPNLVI